MCRRAVNGVAADNDHDNKNSTNSSDEETQIFQISAKMANEIPNPTVS